MPIGILHSLLDRPEPDAHVVQLYRDHNSLARNVARGPPSRGRGVVIATPEHRQAFREQLERRAVDVVAAEKETKLLFLDAVQTLGRFMVDGRPEWHRFETFITAVVKPIYPNPGARVQAYGEMVGILWMAGEYSAAIKLEDFWNRILSTLGASLFCSYPIDVFGPEFVHSSVHAILCDHTHVLPAEETESLESAIRGAINQVLGYEGARQVHSQIESSRKAAWGVVPSPEQMILWLREHLPDLAPEILRIARHGALKQTSPLAS